MNETTQLTKMENLKIDATEDTPMVLFEPETGNFIIDGRSLPEDVTSFYKPVLDWLDGYNLNPLAAATFKFKLEYFNTASSKVILDILMKLEEILSDNKSRITIEWHYMESDSDMLEAGEEFKELIEVPFNFFKY